MNLPQKRYEDKLLNFVSGYKWLQILTVRIRRRTIAVYIYILYIIILCNHVTTVTTTNASRIGVNIIFSYVSLVTLVTWLQTVYCYCFHENYKWLQGGYKVVTDDSV